MKPKGGKRPKEKGSRYEREVVSEAKGFGLEAKRVPLSGAAEGFKGDLIIENMVFECKCKKDGFKMIYDYLGYNNGLHIKQDHNISLTVIPTKDYFELLEVYKKHKKLEEIKSLLREGEL